MHAYLRHIGDYTTDAKHLSVIEHGAYGLLLDLYYSREGPLPALDVLRLVGARDEAEQQATARVLHEFFELNDEHTLWVHKRCEAEIARYRVKADKAAAAARKRWGNADAMPTHSERNADALQTHSESTADGMQTRTMSHNHEPLRSQASAASAPPRAAPARDLAEASLAGQVCKVMRQVGVPDVNPSHPQLLQLLAAGATVEEMRFAAAESAARGKPSFAYTLGVVAGRRKDATLNRPPNAPGSRQSAERDRAKAWAPLLFANDPEAANRVEPEVLALPSDGERNA